MTWDNAAERAIQKAKKDMEKSVKSSPIHKEISEEAASRPPVTKQKDSGPRSLKEYDIDRLCEILMDNGGNLTDACKRLRINRQSVYDRMEVDEEVRNKIQKFRDRGVEALEDEAKRRAFQGVKEPVFYQGKRVGAVKKSSDNLLMFLLRAEKPEKYADRMKTELTASSRIEQNVSLSNDILDYVNKLKSASEKSAADSDDE